MELKCNNPECKGKIKVRSAEVFKNKEYTFTYEECNKVTIYVTSKFVDDFKKKMKAMGITVS